MDRGPSQDRSVDQRRFWTTYLMKILSDAGTKSDASKLARV
jgi:hypothetical protein